ncbi:MULTISPECIES: FecR domain-containing protein [unclassified Treponema]|uniref:FecR family protein n=1 Tax=unclassified Treponema TaxID=2638727 RepID=UPI0020A28D11|nr:MULTISPECIES: FecR family protein [unclassified Treponema]UTC67782.1 FecR domain-containing protein [Treponema sp. OMZ 789]UTC70507.1 FecR domain-containing protein [Treponema sp. OMZ 790]UTC73219.1 FecR domain-containing protein [Treponema sp. OMZ 791]
MKKIFFVIGLFCFISSSLLALDGKVIAVKGKAEIKQGGRWVPAAAGNIITSGSMISTGFKSELTLQIDGSVITVRPMTRLTIEEITQKNEAVSSEVYLNVGSVKADVKPASTKRVEFKVKTPVATASVRGTSGEISSDGLLVGTSGTWSYVNSSGLETKVSIGDSVIISDTGMVTPAQNIKANEVLPQPIQTLAEAEANSPSIIAQTLPLENSMDIASSFSHVGIGIVWGN